MRTYRNASRMLLSSAASVGLATAMATTLAMASKSAVRRKRPAPEPVPEGLSPGEVIRGRPDLNAWNAQVKAKKAAKRREKGKS